MLPGSLYQIQLEKLLDVVTHPLNEVQFIGFVNDLAGRIGTAAIRECSDFEP